VTDDGAETRKGFVASMMMWNSLFWIFIDQQHCQERATLYFWVIISSQLQVSEAIDLGIATSTSANT
jgi:hypothetical protein